MGWDSGIWEGFIEGLDWGDIYKYGIKHTVVLFRKRRSLCFAMGKFYKCGSIVIPLSTNGTIKNGWKIAIKKIL
jgi:1,4-alpha-glucan branching enzyme